MLSELQKYCPNSVFWQSVWKTSVDLILFSSGCVVELTVLTVVEIRMWRISSMYVSFFPVLHPSFFHSLCLRLQIPFVLGGTSASLSRALVGAAASLTVCMPV